MTNEELREEAKRILVGYNDRDIDIFVQGARFAGLKTPQKRPKEWYEERAKSNKKADAFYDYLMTRSPLTKAVENLEKLKNPEEIVFKAFEIFFHNMVFDANYRDPFLNVFIDILIKDWSEDTTLWQIKESLNAYYDYFGTQNK